MKQEFKLTDKAPPIVETLGIQKAYFDPEAGTSEVHYKVGMDKTHSGGIVQGGILTALLDNCMAYAIMCQLGPDQGFTSLEIKTSFLETAWAGDFVGTARTIRKGKTISFLEAELRNAEGQLVVTATTTNKHLTLRKS